MAAAAVAATEAFGSIGVDGDVVVAALHGRGYYTRYKHTEQICVCLPSCHPFMRTIRSARVSVRRMCSPLWLSSSPISFRLRTRMRRTRDMLHVHWRIHVSVVCALTLVYYRQTCHEVKYKFCACVRLIRRTTFGCQCRSVAAIAAAQPR